MGHVLGIVMLGAMLALAVLAYLAALTYTQSATMAPIGRKPRVRLLRAGKSLRDHNARAATRPPD
jgi:hypothetical protein